MSQKSLSLSEIHTFTFRGISLNPGSIQNDHLKENWKTLRNRGLHFIYLNINSLLPKTDELREIVKISNSTGIDNTETKLDNSTGDPEISIDGCSAIGRDRNRKGGGVIYYVTNKICCNTKNSISNVLVEISLSNFFSFFQLQLGSFINLQIKQGFWKYCQTV